jgi:hypothetical protein
MGKEIRKREKGERRRKNRKEKKRSGREGEKEKNRKKANKKENSPAPSLNYLVTKSAQKRIRRQKAKNLPVRLRIGAFKSMTSSMRRPPEMLSSLSPCLFSRAERTGGIYWDRNFALLVYYSRD